MFHRITQSARDPSTQLTFTTEMQHKTIYSNRKVLPKSNTTQFPIQYPDHPHDEERFDTDKLMRLISFSLYLVMNS